MGWPSASEAERRHAEGTEPELAEKTHAEVLVGTPSLMIKADRPANGEPKRIFSRYYLLYRMTSRSNRIPQEGTPIVTFQLYNSLTRRVEPVRTLEEGHLRIYACGPTVYSYAHIGNFRSFLTSDLILRTARAIGWRTTYVTNITDVGHLTDDDVADSSGEDKMAKALHSEEGRGFANIWDLAAHYERSVLEDWHALNLLEPDVRPRATQHIREQLLAVQRLVEMGHAYETTQGVYFSVPTFPQYGKLSGNEAAHTLEHGLRDLVTDPEKRDPRDFALWKKDEKHLMQWYSPWGWGFPGWHIECSVMASTYLGETIDIHAGGEDLRFPHHECEIAQSESLTGKPFARHWVHTRFLQVEGEKMSKSRGNFFTVGDLVRPVSKGGRGLDPIALRLALMSGQYRKPFNFTEKNLQDSAKVVARFRAVFQSASACAVDDAPADFELGSRLTEIADRTLAALLDDLNTPAALATSLEGIKLLEQLRMSPSTATAALDYLGRMESLLGIAMDQGAETSQADAGQGDGAAAEAHIVRLVAERDAARAARNWALADSLRDELLGLDVEIKDTSEGTVWRRRSAS